ncbi:MULTISPECIES: hypothetical protein [unclassified Bradyrhizobium]|uniref:hypothetical protein n=1 Tax=unclassified Bradyrhizobium TaxID=2631580 RepID=UPI0028E2A578|nr:MULTISPECIES: hypothetical protein [unclassified Bradyrhizobium]
MARALTAYLKRADVPARKALQQAIDRLPFALMLDDAYAPFETAGYLPCTLDGEDAGFDLRFKDAAAELAATPALQSAIGDRDVAISCKWGGDPREEAAALAVCAAFMREFDAIVVRDGALLTSDDMLRQAKGALV